jgi:hypothetical protein
MSDRYYSSFGSEEMGFFNPTIDTSIQSTQSPSYSPTSLNCSPSFSPDTFSPSTKKARLTRANIASRPTFHSTKQLANLYSLDRTASYNVALDPQIERGFFLSDGMHKSTYIQAIGLVIEETTFQ